MRRLVTIEDGTRTIYRYVDDHEVQRSSLPRPYVISDIMDPLEQVDGKFYTSKRQFRAVGRALGLTEVGNEKPKPRKRILPDGNAIAMSVKKAIEKYQSS